MYGSLTTIILIMLWLYGCMYIILLGGELNALIEKFYFGRKRGTGPSKKRGDNPAEKTRVDKPETCVKME